MRPVLLIFFVFFFASCFNQGDCIITSTNLVKVGLFNKDKTPRPTTFIRVAELEDGLEFVGTDTLVTSLQLPLSPNRLEASYLFVTNDSVTYTLHLNYRTYTRIIATDCGAFLYYQDLSVPETDFYKVSVITPQLFKSVTTNLAIYF